MPTNSLVIVTALIIGIASTSYFFLRDDAVLKPMEATTPSSNSTPSRSSLNTPLDEKRRDQRATPESQRLTLMTEKVAALETRLRDLEATARQQAQAQAAARPDDAEANRSTETATAKKLAEADFGQWLDAVLTTGGFDREATQVTMEHLAGSLRETPDASLADLQCGEQFCRASFAPDNGNPPNMAQVMSASPFINSGFTLTEPDGQVRVYFTQQGQSFRALRREAQEHALSERLPK